MAKGAEVESTKNERHCPCCNKMNTRTLENDRRAIIWCLTTNQVFDVSLDDYKFDEKGNWKPEYIEQSGRQENA